MSSVYRFWDGHHRNIELITAPAMSDTLTKLDAESYVEWYGRVSEL